LRIALGLRETTDLTTELLADGESGCVVGGTVDAVPGAESLHRLARTLARHRELAVSVEGLDVVVDAKGHGVFSLMTVGVIGSSRGNSLSPSPNVIGRAGETFRKFLSTGTMGPRPVPRPHPIHCGEERRRDGAGWPGGHPSPSRPGRSLRGPISVPSP